MVLSLALGSKTKKTPTQAAQTTQGLRPVVSDLWRWPKQDDDLRRHRGIPPEPRSHGVCQRLACGIEKSRGLLCSHDQSCDLAEE